LLHRRSKMAEKFGLNGEVKELKIGRTFEKNPGQSAFHTVRYDFKPASVDSSRDGVLTVDENKSVSITVPHLHGNGQTNFRWVKSTHHVICRQVFDEGFYYTLIHLDMCLNVFWETTIQKGPNYIFDPYMTCKKKDPEFRHPLDSLDFKFAHL